MYRDRLVVCWTIMHTGTIRNPVCHCPETKHVRNGWISLVVWYTILSAIVPKLSIDGVGPLPSSARFQTSFWNCTETKYSSKCTDILTRLIRNPFQRLIRDWCLSGLEWKSLHFELNKSSPRTTPYQIPQFLLPLASSGRKWWEVSAEFLSHPARGKIGAALGVIFVCARDVPKIALKINSPEVAAEVTSQMHDYRGRIIVVIFRQYYHHFLLFLLS